MVGVRGMGGRCLQHTAGTSVVELVRHTLLDGGVCLNVDVLAQPVVGQVGGQVRHAILAEWTREHVAGAAAVTLGLWHLETAEQRRSENFARAVRLSFCPLCGS